jgi:hypothetical protein
VAGHALELEGVDEPLGGLDVVVDAVEAVLAAVALALDEAPAPARAGLQLVDDRLGAVQAPPVADRLGVGEGREDQVAGGVEAAGDDDLLGAGVGDDLHVAHGNAPLLCRAWVVGGQVACWSSGGSFLCASRR